MTAKPVFDHILNVADARRAAARRLPRGLFEAPMERAASSIFSATNSEPRWGCWARSVSPISGRPIAVMNSAEPSRRTQGPLRNLLVGSISGLQAMAADPAWLAGYAQHYDERDVSPSL